MDDADLMMDTPIFSRVFTEAYRKGRISPESLHNILDLYWADFE